MYEKFYGLKEKPFEITPDPRFLYMSQQHREASGVHAAQRRGEPRQGEFHAREATLGPAPPHDRHGAAVGGEIEAPAQQGARGRRGREARGARGTKQEARLPHGAREGHHQRGAIDVRAPREPCHALRQVREMALDIAAEILDHPARRPLAQHPHELRVHAFRHCAPLVETQVARGPFALEAHEG